MFVESIKIKNIYQFKFLETTFEKKKLYMCWRKFCRKNKFI